MHYYFLRRWGLLESVTLSEVFIDTEKNVVIIKDLRIDDPTVYNYLVDLDENARIEFVKRALKIGSDVIQIMGATQRVDYVKGTFDNMQKEIGEELENIFSEKGPMLSALDRFLGKEGELKKVLDAHFGEQGSVIYKILNPDDESTPLGKFRKQLQEQLDVNREDSAFHQLNKAMDEGFQEILIALGAAEAREREREKGTEKGRSFEKDVYELLDIMARDFEDTVEFVGNKDGPLGNVGDVLITLNSRDTRATERKIVVEVKNRKPVLSGKNSFLKELDKAKENRSAEYSIGAVHESKVPKAVGCFRKYDGGKIICSVPIDSDPLPLEIAYKMARAEIILESLREDVQFDPTKIKDSIAEIQGQLDAMGAVYTALKGAKGKIDDASGDLRKLESSIRETLDELLIIMRREDKEDARALSS